MTFPRLLLFIALAVVAAIVVCRTHVLIFLINLLTMLQVVQAPRPETPEGPLVPVIPPELILPMDPLQLEPPRFEQTLWTA